MIGFPVGLIAANFGEWLIHKYVLHGEGRKKDAFFSHHWTQHHRDSRKEDGLDASYKVGWWKTEPRKREALGLVAIALAFAPVAWFAPWFVAGLWTHAALYYFVHKKSHQDPAWMRRHLRWHYDHHMGRNQHANWCVTYPLADYVLRTREPWADTADEAAARERIAARRAKKVAAASAEPLRPSQRPILL
ncbi:MAG: sterol desaturase family protein [Sandaracinaceae bacterium]|jgi:hypothetical protein|nr:sterol desaturase family protein [Sandaracinaceae bacterium]